MPRPRVPDRRRRVLEAARDLALEKGWAATTIAEIATRAGIGKGAVYLEFEDKPAILDAVLLRSMRGLAAEVHRQVLHAEGVIDLPTIYRIAVEALLTDPLMRAFHLGDESVLGDHARTVGDERYRQRFGWLLDYISRLQDAGVIAPDVTRATLARVLSVFTTGLLHAPSTIGPLTDDELRETVGQFADLVGTGIAPEHPADPDIARAAYLDLLGTLHGQLDQLEET